MNKSLIIINVMHFLCTKIWSYVLHVFLKTCVFEKEKPLESLLTVYLRVQHIQIFLYIVFLDFLERRRRPFLDRIMLAVTPSASTTDKTFFTADFTIFPSLFNMQRLATKVLSCIYVLSCRHYYKTTYSTLQQKL